MARLSKTAFTPTAINIFYHLREIKDELYHIIADHSGQTFDKVYEDSDRDYWMTAREALKYGMIDEILERDNE